MADLHKALSDLEAVLCGPDGSVCCSGSQADKDIIATSLAALREALAKPAVPEVPHGVHHAAKIFVKSDYRGPLARAKLVFDWVASLPAAPQPKDKP